MSGTVAGTVNCSVLRCLQAASGWFALMPYSTREVPVCAGHKTSLDSGVLWMVHPSTDLRVLRDVVTAANIAIVMEEDLPSRSPLVGFELSRTVGSEIGFSVELTIETSDGPQEVTFWMSQEDGQQIGSWLATSPTR